MSDFMWQPYFPGSGNQVLVRDGAVVGGVFTYVDGSSISRLERIPRGVWRGWLCLAGEIDTFTIMDGTKSFYVCAFRSRAMCKRALLAAYHVRAEALAVALLARMDGVLTPRELERRGQGW